MKDVVSKTARDIKSMKVRGALDIAVAAAEALRNSVALGKTPKDLAKDGAKLKYARPTAVSLPNAVNYVLEVVEENKNLAKSDFKKKNLEQIDSFISEQKNSIARIAEIGSRLIEKNDTILTHCQSDTVEGIFIKAWKDGVKFDVVCTETRPRHQGYLTAKILKKNKVPVTLIIDSAVNHMLKKLEVDKVFVGADAVLANGDVINKIGTSQVAVCANSMEIELIVATQSIKFSPESVYGKVIEIEDRGSKEITSELKGVRILNPAFDVTPAHHISKIITEHGIIPPAAAYQMLRHFKYKIENE
ncbi:MAG: S-methyl-5-thioribose-1-phosphate isomerase [Candidatus Altiarchaeales archaeon]|nr:S-methyl-5-thioribose-1-phosphate isomerase [Candidatus Altiarchaeales archaeon]